MVPTGKPLIIYQHISMDGCSLILLQKRVSKVVQQAAFLSSNDNAFNSYVFDPNKIEKSLESAATEMKQARKDSIFPSNFTTNTPRRSFRTPATRRKNCSAPSRISSAGLLKQKAIELQHHHQQMTPQFIADGRRQIGVYGGTCGTEGIQDTLESKIAGIPHHQFMAPTGLTTYQSFGIANNPEFTQAFNCDVPFIRAPLFMKDDYYAPFTQTRDTSVSSADPSHGYWMHNSLGRNPALRSNDVGSLTQTSRPISSAGYSNGSGLQRFRQDMHQHQILRGNGFRFPHEHEMLHPEQHMPQQPHYNFRMPSHINGRFENFDFSVSRGVAEHSRTKEFDNPSLFEFNVMHNQPKHWAPVQNPYSRSQPAHAPMHTDPPKEIVLQNSNRQAMDDASLAFDDAFL